jgi:exosortase/archaeosortase family protein
LIAAAGIWLEHYQMKHNSGRPYRAFVAASGCWVASCLGSAASAEETTIVAGRRALEVTPECAGIDAVSIFVAGVVALPCPLRKKLLGLLIGLVGVPVLNILRVAALAGVADWRPEWFEPMHKALMHMFPLFAVLPLWLLWLWLILRRGSTDDRAPRSPTPEAATA